MALKHKLDSLDGLEEALKPLYAKGEDGRYTLQVDEAPATNTIAKLKADLDAATKALKDRETNEAKAAQAAKEAADLAAGNFEKVNAARDAALKAAQEELQSTRLAHENHLKETKALTLLGPLAATPKTLEALKGDFMSQLEVVEGKVLVKGNPALSPESLVDTFKSNPDYAPFIKGTGASGGGAPQTGRPSPGGEPTSSHAQIAAGLKAMGLGA